MYRRILTLAMLAATLSISLFGIPLALYAAHYYRADERTELERTADTAAINIAADLFHGRFTGDLPAPADGTTLALYTSDGRLLGGQGPSTADPVVAQALTDNMVHHTTAGGRFLVTVPIADGPNAAYVVRVTASTSEVYPRIALTWALMLTLVVLILTLTWRLARAQAHRLARPLEHLSVAAGRLGDGDFSVRTQPSGIPEIDSAGTALNRTAIRIGELVDRERALTADTSHQLRTPLTGLRLGLEAALDSPTSDLRQAINDAIAITDRLENTINDLTTLARDPTHSTALLPLPALLAETRDTWGPRLSQSGRALSITAEPDLPPSQASTAAVRQILAVLLDNASTHGVGTVTIHARHVSSTTALDVSDEGTHLDHDDVTLFHRGTANGHGIGLPLARSLAEADGGRLGLSSRTPTTFTLFLPASPQPEQTQPNAR